jgi:lysophospholipase L1-like esterase
MIKNKQFRYAAATVLAIALLGGFFIFGKEVKKRWVVYVTLNCPHWKERYNEMQQIPQGKYKTVFLGNSLTEMFDLNAYFNDSALVNFGIVGDFSEGLVKRAKLVTRLKPDRLFIEIGINDMIEQVSLAEICSNYRELIGIIQKESPGTKIFVQSNLPLIINRPSWFTGDTDVNNLVLEQNVNLQKIAAETGCVYVDICTEMIKEKNKESLFIWDGLHLTDKAYQIWTDKVKDYLVSESK